MSGGWSRAAARPGRGEVRRARVRWWIAPVLAVAATACGDDAASPPVAAPTPTTAAPGATSTTTAPMTPAPPSTTAPAPAGALPTSPAEVPVPASPEAVAAALGRVEVELREQGADSPGALGWIQQQAYAAIRAEPAWFDEVVALVPDAVRDAVAANARAEISLGGITSPPSDLPAWEIRAPRPAEELVGYYREAQAASGVRWEYLAAIHLVETRMGRIVGESWAGAQGPMQFMPPTWEAYGAGDVWDDRDAILAAARYLAATGAPDDMDAALHAYNPTDRYVRAVRAYAETMLAAPAAYHGYYHWQVHYRAADGRYLLPEGYGADGTPAVRLD